jgi:drug/metabolite transporter (DMT)-like permease
MWISVVRLKSGDIHVNILEKVPQRVKGKKKHSDLGVQIFMFFAFAAVFAILAAFSYAVYVLILRLFEQDWGFLLRLFLVVSAAFFFGMWFRRRERKTERLREEKLKTPPF